MPLLHFHHPFSIGPQPLFSLQFYHVLLPTHTSHLALQFHKVSLHFWSNQWWLFTLFTHFIHSPCNLPSWSIPPLLHHFTNSHFKGIPIVLLSAISWTAFIQSSNPESPDSIRCYSRKLFTCCLIFISTMKWSESVSSSLYNLSSPTLMKCLLTRI